MGLSHLERDFNLTTYCPIIVLTPSLAAKSIQKSLSNF
jgi:hypothetical protein